MKRTLLIVSNDYNQHSIICWDSRLKVDKQMQLHRFGGVYPVAAIAVETDIKTKRGDSNFCMRKTRFPR